MSMKYTTLEQRARARLLAYLSAHLVTPGYDSSLSPGERGYRPFCLLCDTMQRMAIAETGFECGECGARAEAIGEEQ